MGTTNKKLANKLSKVELERPYLIIWDDAALQSEGWLQTDHEVDLCIINSVGFVHKLDSKKIVIKQNQDGEDYLMSNLTAIPIVCILYIKLLS